MTMLKRSHDKASPCLKFHTVSKDSDRFIPIMMELLGLLNVILHSLISFAGVLSSNILGKNAIPYGAIEVCFTVEIKMVCVNLVFVGLYQDLMVEYPRF